MGCCSQALELSCTEEQDNSKLLVVLLEQKNAEIESLRRHNQRLMAQQGSGQAKLDMERVAEGLWMLEAELTKQFKFYAEESERRMCTLEETIFATQSKLESALVRAQEGKQERPGSESQVPPGAQSEMLALAGDDRCELLRSQAEVDALTAEKKRMKGEIMELKAQKVDLQAALDEARASSENALELVEAEAVAASTDRRKISQLFQHLDDIRERLEMYHTSACTGGAAAAAAAAAAGSDEGPRCGGKFSGSANRSGGEESKPKKVRIQDAAAPPASATQRRGGNDGEAGGEDEERRRRRELEVAAAAAEEVRQVREAAAEELRAHLSGEAVLARQQALATSDSALLHTRLEALQADLRLQRQVHSNLKHPAPYTLHPTPSTLNP